MTEAQTKRCQSCQAEFTIEPEDFAFYQKIQVPPPTWCPDCRAQRRMAWRNEWHLFRKPDAIKGEEIFSGFSPSSPIKVTTNDYWNSDAWDPLAFGRTYDFSKPFFQQVEELLYKVPVPARSILQLENSDYSFNCGYLRNCYLVCAATGTEDSAYLVWDHRSRNCMDDHMTASSELCYGSLNLANCYQTHYSMNCEGCRDVIFSRDMVGCSNCVGCTNLRNKQYYIWNKPYSEAEYKATLNNLKLGSYRHWQQVRDQVGQFWMSQPNKFVLGSSNEQVSGEYIYQSKNVTNSFRIRGSEESKYCQNILNGPHKDCYDQTNFGENSELVYESLQCGINVYNLQFCVGSYSNNKHLRYSIYCQSSSDLFGCVSIRSKQYCILNKQYTKEEYERLVPRIIEHMNSMPYVDRLGRQYRYGEFFPSELSPLEYNLTVGYEEFPLLREEALAAGYRWYDRPRQERPRLLRLRAGRGLQVLQPDAGSEAVLRYDDLGPAGRAALRMHGGWVQRLPQSVRWYQPGQPRHLLLLHGDVFAQSLWLRRGQHGQYLILNKQHTKEEYEALVPRIIEHMRGTGEWGEFFPSSISPFAYNEALSSDWLPLVKEAALALGAKWRDPDPRDFQPQTYDVPDDSADVSEVITQQLLACVDCRQNFKIIPHELSFYKLHKLPIPERCPQCRHEGRMSKRNPRHLWHRQCACAQSNHDHQGQCPVNFETSYSPDRLEIVYCESCYQAEVV